MKNLFALLLFVSAVYMNAQEKSAGKFSGYMFGDYFYNVVHDSSTVLSNAAIGDKGRDYNGFQFRRIYFTYDNDISSIFTSRFRIDGSPSTPIIKDAYLKWKNVFAGSDIYIGIQPTPAFEISDAAWGYRSLEKTIMDLRGIALSRDFGVSLRGRMDSKGIFNYWLMVGNNYQGVGETDRYKRIYANVQLKPIANLQITAFADYTKKGNISNANSNTVPKALLNNDDFTTAVFVGYGVKDEFNVGVEAFIKSTMNGYAVGSVPNVAYGSNNVIGVSVFASANVAKDLAIVARADTYDPNDNVNGDSRNYFLAGLNWIVDKNVMIMPNVQAEMYESMPNGGRKFDSSVTARVTVYYIFL